VPLPFRSQAVATNLPPALLEALHEHAAAEGHATPAALFAGFQ